MHNLFFHFSIFLLQILSRQLSRYSLESHSLYTLLFRASIKPFTPIMPHVPVHNLFTTFPSSALFCHSFFNLL